MPRVRDLRGPDLPEFRIKPPSGPETGTTARRPGLTALPVVLPRRCPKKENAAGQAQTLSILQDGKGYPYRLSVAASAACKEWDSMDASLEWITRLWLEIGGFIATCAALFYAHRAYRTSALGLAHAKQAELNSIRIQTKSALNDARQSLVSLDLNCQNYRAQWASHRRKQGMMLGVPRSIGLLESSPIDAVQYEGKRLLSQLDSASATVDAMDLQALETLQQRAKDTALGIQELALKLESPS